jgi:hypothetical protein
VRGYPTLKLIHEATAKVYVYKGGRDLDSLKKFAESDWKDASPTDYPLPDGSTAKNDATSGSKFVAADRPLMIRMMGFAEAHPLIAIVYCCVILVAFLGLAIVLYDYVVSTKELQHKTV